MSPPLLETQPLFLISYIVDYGGFQMSRTLSLFFVIISIGLLIASGIALSYFAAGISLICLIGSFVVTGIGLAIKRARTTAKSS
jgi:hypothetical protein